MGQIIVTVSREFGSGGHQLASIIAERLGIPLYDKNILEHMAQKNNITAESLHKFDEMKRRGFNRTIGGYTTSTQEHVAQIEFEFIREKAESGESFVVVGRCSDYILRDNPNTFKIFVMSEPAQKIERVSRLYHVSEEEAKRMAHKLDKTRRAYHNFYSDMKWGDSRGYDLCINTAKLGIDVTAQQVCDIIAAFAIKN